MCNVGIIGPGDAARVEQLLHRNGIRAGCEGSIVYGVFVRKADAERAVALIGDMDLSLWQPATPLPHVAAR